ncbi:DNA-directed RNA polymerase subunit beta, partial [Candidatus Woesebacteria bacterium CG22_combo_CG10-13_8_21_14_all_45_10]
IGLVTYLALYTRVNEFGFLETPYRKIKKTKRGKDIKAKVTEEVVYLTADDEEEYYITYSGVNIDRAGFLTDRRIPLRHKGNFTEGPVDLVDYIDVTPRQVIGASASLIPFLGHDEGNRSLMGSNMQCQAVPLVNPESPVVGTGMETEIAKGMGRVIYARHSGKVTFCDAKTIEVKLDQKVEAKSSFEDIEIAEGGRKENYHLLKFRRTAHSTCYNQKAVVSPGQKIKAGDLLADGPAVEAGELALGRNLLIAYTSLAGYG